jgi:hypothetical protein
MSPRLGIRPPDDPFEPQPEGRHRQSAPTAALPATSAVNQRSAWLRLRSPEESVALAAGGRGRCLRGFADEAEASYSFRGGRGVSCGRAGAMPSGVP